MNEVENLLEDRENPLALQMGGKLMDLSHSDGQYFHITFSINISTTQFFKKPLLFYQ